MAEKRAKNSFIPKPQKRSVKTANIKSMSSAKAADKAEVVLSKAEREIIFDVLNVEKINLDLSRNENKDAKEYGDMLESLQKKLQAA